MSSNQLSQQYSQYSVELTDTQILVNGPDVVICQEIARGVRDEMKVDETKDNDKPVMGDEDETKMPEMIDEAISPVTQEGGLKDAATSNASSSKHKRKKIKTKEDKVKTEPGNSWIQFCQFKKNKAVLDTGNEDASFDFKVARDEWSNMSKEEKSFYVGLAKAEKHSLGENYRSQDLRSAVSKEESSKQHDKKRKNRKTGGKTKKTRKLEDDIVEEEFKEIDGGKDFSTKSLKFLNRLAKVDEEIETLEMDNNDVMKKLEQAKIALAVSKCELENKKEGLEKAEEKYNVLVKQHATCQPR